MEKVTADLVVAERAFIDNPSVDRANTIRLYSRVITQLQYEKSKRKLFFHKQKLFEHGKRASKLLAYLVACEERPAVVISLSSRGGELVSKPRKVTEIFRDFFASLYTFTVSEDNSTIDSFLNEVQLPQLTTQQTAELEKLLLVEEIAEAIVKFP